jgi:CBS domain-containing protein
MHTTHPPPSPDPDVVRPAGEPAAEATAALLPGAGQNDPLAVPLRSLTRRRPVLCGQSTPVRTAVERMRSEQVGAIVITDAEQIPVGVFTLHDLRDRVVLGGCRLDDPIAGVMSPDPVSLPLDAPALEAAMAMARHSIHHVVLTETGRAAGVVSEGDLFAVQQRGIARIAKALRAAGDPAALQAAAEDIRALARNLVAQGVGAEQVTRLISQLNDQLAGNLIGQVFAAAAADTAPPGLRWCWLALGSEGRLEQTLCTDQDNGLVFGLPEGGDAEAARAWLLPRARRVNEGLAACGFPLCKGEIMAGNPKWCLSLDEWRDTFADWIFRGDAPVLLNASIFFDFRALTGDADLATELRRWLLDRIRDHRQFLRLMTLNALGNRPPLGLIRDFVLAEDGAHPHTLDLKVNGVTLFVDAARIFALAAGVGETATAARLRAAAAVWKLDEAETESWVQAFHALQGMRLAMHQDQYLTRREMHNHLDPDDLAGQERRLLKESLREARRLQNRLETFFQF